MKQSAKDEFVRACEEYSDALFRYSFYKISDREAAKDLVQETYAKTWSYLAKGGEEIKNMRAFFYRTLNNLIIDEYRKKKTISLDQMAEAGFDPEWNNPENQEDKLDGEKAIAMLRHIPPMYQEVIFMRYVEDLTLKEIASITGESENAVAVKVHRGLKKVKKVYDKE